MKTEKQLYIEMTALGILVENKQDDLKNLLKDSKYTEAKTLYKKIYDLTIEFIDLREEAGKK